MSERKEKFTPGPWIVLHATNVMSPCNGYIARAYNSPLGPIANRYNATLIAAAPEMYDLLKRIKGMLEFCELEDKIDVDTEHEIGALLRKARGEA